MTNDLLVLTELAMVRVLKCFALRLGLSDTFADVLAQVFVQQEPMIHLWHEFLLKNCSGCELTPNSCAFFAPTEEQCHPGVGPADIRAGNMLVLEMGRCKTCPVRKARE